MAAVPEIDGIEDNLAALLRSLSSFNLQAVPAKVYIGEWVPYVRDGFDSFGIEAYPTQRTTSDFEANQPVASVRFLLNQVGLKTVDVSSRGQREFKEGPERDLAGTAALVEKQIRFFTRSGTIYPLR
jgi:hypothetical protein